MFVLRLNTQLYKNVNLKCLVKNSDILCNYNILHFFEEKRILGFKYQKSKLKTV